MPPKPKTESSPDRAICTICHLEKPLARFFVDKRRKIGVTSACRECMNKVNNEAKYKQLAEREGIQSLYDLREKQERNLRIIGRVIAAVEEAEKKV